MDLSQDAKEIFETTDDEISDQEAIEITADWSVAVSSTRTPNKTKTKKIWISATKKWNISKPIDQVMDSLVVSEEIIDQFDDEISGQEALEFFADWSFSATVQYLHYVFDANKNFECIQPKIEIFQNRSISNFIWTHQKLLKISLTRMMVKLVMMKLWIRSPIEKSPFSLILSLKSKKNSDFFQPRIESLQNPFIR